MRQRDIVAVLVENRNESAITVQKIMTGWGCMIKTRLGLHDGVLNKCSQTGLIILEMVGESDKIDEFVRKVNLVKGADAKHIRLDLGEEDEET